MGTGAPLIDRLYAPRHHSLPDALAAHGLAPADVACVVNTHLHFDHCGQNRLFSGVPVYVQEAELRAARQPHYTVREWFDHAGARLVPLAGDHTVARGVQVIASPGHTPGHQSVLVETPAGPELVCGQAVYDAAEWSRGGDETDLPGYRESVRSLAALAAQRVRFSHDEREGH